MTRPQDFEIQSRTLQADRIVPPSEGDSSYHLSGVFEVDHQRAPARERHFGPLCNVDGRAVRSKGEKRETEDVEYAEVTPDRLRALVDGGDVCEDCLALVDGTEIGDVAPANR